MDEKHRTSYLEILTVFRIRTRIEDGKAVQVVIYEWTKTREKQRRPRKTFFIAVTCLWGKTIQFF